MKSPVLFITDAGHGETPPCPDAIFRRGDVVLLRKSRSLPNLPRELIILVAIPPGFSPDWAQADLLNQPRPLAARKGACDVTYFGVKQGDHQLYIAREKDLTPTGKSVEIGSIRREGVVA